MRCLVTGTAGFIGFQLARRLLDDGHQVTGLDGFTAYYDVALKERRHALLASRNGFSAHRVMMEHADGVADAWGDARYDLVVHLAGQAGVRYSIDNPKAYIDGNVVGTFNVLECARRHGVGHLMLASTSSAYGNSATVPFRETDRTAHPVSVYAATKLATEVIAHSYSHIWRLPTTMFRFFTVYGPWGRPDMAPHKFTRGIIGGAPIDVYNHGNMERDFTYIDDLIESIVRLASVVPGTAPVGTVDTLSPDAPFRLVNIGAGAPVNLMHFIEAIETAVGRKAERRMMEMQPGDVPRTFASAELLEALTGYRPATKVEDGVAAFVAWYREYYGV